jgi:hypothetical protein
LPTREIIPPLKVNGLSGFKTYLGFVVNFAFIRALSLRVENAAVDRLKVSSVNILI